MSDEQPVEDEEQVEPEAEPVGDPTPPAAPSFNHRYRAYTSGESD